jgi:hypothetical protein
MKDWNELGHDDQYQIVQSLYLASHVYTEDALTDFTHDALKSLEVVYNVQLNTKARDKDTIDIRSISFISWD